VCVSWPATTPLRSLPMYDADRVDLRVTTYTRRGGAEERDSYVVSKHLGCLIGRDGGDGSYG
jgi:hypothetical protein